MTKDELIELLQASQLPDFCITEPYVAEMLKKSDAEIHDEIADINSFWDAQYAQHRWKMNRYRFPRHEPASRKTAFRTLPEKGHCCGLKF
jgi:hypothetical protein